MASAVKLNDNIIDARRQLQLQHNFLKTTGGSTFTVTADAEAALDVRGGGVSIASSNVDNNEAFITTAKICQIGDGYPFYFSIYSQFAEAATNDAGVFIGLSSTAAASVLTDDGAGIPADFTGFAFYKLDGETLWRVGASVGTGQNLQQLSATNTLDKTARTAGGSAYQFLEIIGVPKTSALADIIFRIDGTTVYKMTDFVITSALAASVMAIIKAGGANVETLRMKFLNFVHVR